MGASAWLDERTAAGVRQRRFTIEREAAAVPGVLWTPERAGRPVPLVLLGHGGAGHKLDDSRIALGHRYVLEYGCAAAAIDGPWHGDRGPRPGAERPSITRALLDGMVADWTAAADALEGLDEIDERRVGYGGVSMGTMFGIPFVAAEARIRAAVLGLCGLTRETGEPAHVVSERLAADAPEVRCPTLFLMQWDDELFPRDGVLDLFDLVGAGDKRLQTSPGGHSDTPGHVAETTTRFLAAQLRQLH